MILHLGIWDQVVGGVVWETMSEEMRVRLRHVMIQALNNDRKGVILRIIVMGGDWRVPNGFEESMTP